MNNLHDVKTVIASLSNDELLELRDFIVQQAASIPAAYQRSAEERIQQLDAAAQQIREGLTVEDWAKFEQAMNADYIEPLDNNGLPLL